MTRPGDLCGRSCARISSETCQPPQAALRWEPLAHNGTHPPLKINHAVTAEAVALPQQAKGLARLALMARSHEAARTELESQLESQLSSTKHSQYVTDLLQRETRAASQGLHDVCRQLAAKVDAALGSELERHFRARSTAHQKRWLRLFQAQASERESFAQTLRDDIKQIYESLKLPLPPELRSSLASLSCLPYVRERYTKARDEAPLDRAALERKLNEEALRHWAEHERLMLSEGLELQEARVEAQWNASLDEVERGYIEQRGRLDGTQAIQQKGQQTYGRGGALALLKSAAKQSTIVRSTSVKITTQSERSVVDEAFERTRRQMLQQKETAVRQSLKRQSMRMHKHLEYVQQDKELMLQHMERENVELYLLKVWMTTYMKSHVHAKRRVQTTEHMSTAADDQAKCHDQH